MKYQFYAIIFDVAGNTTPIGNSASPAKSFVTNIQKVTGISISPNGSVTKNIGESFTITPTVSPSDANNKTINWDSSNKSISTVDSNGKVTCLAAGSTTITATAADGSGVSANLALTVRNPINSLTLDKDQTTILKDGYTSTVTATTDPVNYDGANISWTIADTSIATVTVSGKTATIKSTSKIGQTTLTVSAGRLSKTVNVSVVNFVTTTYEYTGSVQQVDLPAGTYKLEVWGASGGNSTGTGTRSSGGSGGLGGYSVGTITFENKAKVYVYVGGQGKSANSTDGTTTSGAFPDGGGTKTGHYLSFTSVPGTGGGSTSMRISTDSLYSRIIVAGAGGGAGGDNQNADHGGYGGGISGGNSYCVGSLRNEGSGTQTGSTPGPKGSGVAGVAGTFGQGATGLYKQGNDSGGGGRWRLVWWW